MCQQLSNIRSQFWVWSILLQSQRSQNIQVVWETLANRQSFILSICFEAWFLCYLPGFSCVFLSWSLCTSVCFCLLFCHPSSFQQLAAVSFKSANKQHYQIAICLRTDKHVFLLVQGPCSSSVFTKQIQYP